MSNSNDSDDKKHSDSLGYKVGQRVKYWSEDILRRI
ncbi:hypothetical protein WBP_0542 [Wolbachia endosymbiont of Brugia pahangi]|nr:hypothetical protein WBP_0542 [Wolbachia endosymbiont of Brugia pahangi]